MIATHALTKRYGTKLALDALDLSIPAGEVYCLLGPNGAGKTTTIRLLCGFEEASEGSAWLAGREVARDLAGARAASAYVPEVVALYPRLSGLENLRYLAGLALGRELAEPEGRALLLRAGLAAEAHERLVAGYSKGMRQKVALALALAKDARALLFDEPTSGLDPRAAAEFTDTVRALARAGAAVLMATHDLVLALEAGTRVGILVEGKRVDERRATELDQAELARLYLAHVRR